MKSLHLISTGTQSPNAFVEKVKTIHTSIDYIHFRESNWTAIDHVTGINRLVEAGINPRKIIIHDRVDIAVTQHIGGVQLTSHSLDIMDVKKHFPTLKIGCSVHSVEEALEKEAQGAEYLMYGHIFATHSKKGLPPHGLKNLKEVTRRLNIPVIAIGGVKPNNLSAVLHAGASGIAVLSGILLAEDCTTAAWKYREQMVKEVD